MAVCVQCSGECKFHINSPLFHTINFWDRPIKLCIFLKSSYFKQVRCERYNIQGGSNITGTDLCVNKPHCACASKCLSIMVTKKISPGHI